MGAGAYMKVSNGTTEPVTVFVTTQHCMYDGGAGGSNISYFNNLTIGPGETAPSGGARGQYIEAKSSSTGGDTCATDTSTFTLEFLAPSGTPIGQAQFSERWHSYHGASTNRDLIKVDVGDAGDQYNIDVTLLPP